jgi:hypothetical protein
MPQPRIYDHLLPHAQKVNVADPLMLRATAGAKRKNDRIGGLGSAPLRVEEHPL